MNLIAIKLPVASVRASPVFLVRGTTAEDNVEEDDGDAEESANGDGDVESSVVRPLVTVFLVVWILFPGVVILENRHGAS